MVQDFFRPSQMRRPWVPSKLKAGQDEAAWRLRPVPPQRMRQDFLARVLSRSGGAYRASAARMALISAW